MVDNSGNGHGIFTISDIAVVNEAPLLALYVVIDNGNAMLEFE
jgi:hypothetical protein